MTIFDIDKRIEQLLAQTDEETGEIPASVWDELDALMIDRDVKIENAACKFINVTAEAAAIKEQEKILKGRRETLERQADSIKGYVERATAGEPFTSPRVKVSYRRSKAVDIDDEIFWLNPDNRFLRQKQPDVDKTAIKDALKAGEIIPGAALVERTSMTIK